MAQSATTQPSAAAPRTPQPATRRILWVMGAAVLGFAVAFVIQQARLGRVQREAHAATTGWQAARLEATLSAAVIEAQAGRFEEARQRTSAFYSGMQRELLPRLDSADREAVRAVLVGRDSVITALARNDPGTAGALEAILGRVRETISRSGIDSVPGSPGI